VSIRPGQGVAIDPVDDLRRRLHASATAFKPKAQDLLQTRFQRIK
jgi:hypothetical protein